MDAKEREELLAHRRAGHDAYQAVSTHGADIGGAMIRGAFEAYLLAHATMHGWERTFELVRQLSRGKFVPPIGRSLVLISNKSLTEHTKVPVAAME